MASKQGLPRPLSELLKEQQEPFVLEIYLLERGCPGKSFKKFQKSKNSGNFTNLARNLFNKLGFINEVFRLKNYSGFGDGKQRRKHKESLMESDRLSFTSSNTFDSDRGSLSSPAKNSTVHESAPDRGMNQWRRLVEDNKQFSPVSVLDEIDFLQAIPVYNVQEESTSTSSATRMRVGKRVSEESILSASLWELLAKSRKLEKPKQKGSELLFPQYENSRKALQQTRQLLFDCVREVVEKSQDQKMKKTREKIGLMGPQEIGKLIFNNLKTWGKCKFPVHEKSINQLLKMDLLLGSKEEWGGFDVCKKEMVMEIGDGILENLKDEIVNDMIDQYY